MTAYLWHQQDFMDSRKRYLNLACPIGGGKTFIGAERAAMLTLDSPWSRGMLCGAHRPGLDLMVKEFLTHLRWLSPVRFTSSISTSRHTLFLDFATARVEIDLYGAVHVENDDFQGPYRGREYGWVWFDDAKISLEFVKIIDSRLRVPPSKMLITETLSEIDGVTVSPLAHRLLSPERHSEAFVVIAGPGNNPYLVEAP